MAEKGKAICGGDEEQVCEGSCYGAGIEFLGVGTVCGCVGGVGESEGGVSVFVR